MGDFRYTDFMDTKLPAVNGSGSNGSNLSSTAPNGSATSTGDQIARLEQQIQAAQLPRELAQKVMAMVGRLKHIEDDGNFFTEYDSISRYIEWITGLPWSKSSQDILDLNHAKQVLDKNHYGLTDVKEKVLEYLSIMILKNVRGMADKQHFSRAPILALVGLVGTGKTTVAYSIAEALGRKIERVPFGGMGGASMLRGKSRLFPDAEPGLIIKAMKRAGSSNPVILLDEIDRVSAEARADIMGVLIELLDPEQNQHFIDHFIDHPFDLSNVLFIATSNNTKDISTAVLDRLEIIQMPSYSDNEKIYIAARYMFPRVLQESGLTAQDIIIDEAVWTEVVRPLGYDSGIRSLYRTIQGMVRKVIFYMLQGKIPQGQPFRITAQNVHEFVPQW